MKEKTIAIIPARGGSRRIPKKNIRPLCGKPIIAYTIEAAKKSNLFSHIIVSTESSEIAKISEEFGAEIPYIRKSELADDYTMPSLVTLDMLDSLDPHHKKFDFIAQLMPICPLRDSIDIIDSFSQFMESKAESQISVAHYGWSNPWWAMTKDKNNNVSPIFEEQLKKRSQDLPELFCPTGAIWWIKADTLRREKTFHCPHKTGWEIPWDHAIDIDNEDDWKMAEILMQQRMNINVV